MAQKIMSGRAIMGTAVQGGVGGAAYFIAAKAGPKVQFFQSRWWALPSAMLLAGHVVKRWGPEAGSAVCGAAGAMMAMSYYVQQSTPQVQPGAAPAAGYGGYGTAGAYGPLGPGEAGALMGRAGALALPGNATSAYRRRSEAGALVT
jgi:hypothetical protein